MVIDWLDLNEQNIDNYVNYIDHTVKVEIFGKKFLELTFTFISFSHTSRNFLVKVPNAAVAVAILSTLQTGEEKSIVSMPESVSN